MKITLSFILIALLLVSPYGAMAEVRALLVGVGDYPDRAGPQFPDLAGPPQDVELMRKWLVEDMGVPASSVVTLRDREATSSAIKQAFQHHLVEECDEDDVAVFFFAGHGMEIPDFEVDSDEADGDDEALVPFDYASDDPDTWLKDDLIHTMLSALKTRHVLVVFDACHAGTATRSAFPSNWYRQPSKTGMEMTMKEAAGPDKVLFFASCGPNELSYQVFDKDLGEVVGVFSQSFSAVARVHANSPVVTFRDQLKKRVDEVRRQIGQKIPQTPSVEAERLDFSLSDFLAGKVYGETVEPLENSDASPPVETPPIENVENLGGFTSVGKIGVTLKTDAGEYSWGDKMRVTFTVDQDAFVRVLHLDAEGNFLQIYPNKWKQGQNPVPAGRLFDPLEGTGQTLEVGPPNTGLEMIIAVASEERFTDDEAQNIANAAFNRLPSLSVAEVMVRGISVQPRKRQEDLKQKEIGQAIRIYRVTK